ncbi:MAG TPA: hypothetical protein VJQ55_06420, partial [Candidatus Binatia bacterium]|nr:hypothetical protein [Candidatus Binatia bacterium]
MENFGYILSEAPFLLLIIWTTISFVRWRRARDNRPLFSFSDKRILFHAAQYGPHHWQFYPRLVLASTAVAVLGSLQIV